MKRKVACLLAEGFEDSEFQRPKEALERAGFHVTIVGKQAGATLHGKAKRHSATVEVPLDEASVVDYCALLIPGGKSPKELRSNGKALELVRSFDESGKPIAAICHGPLLLQDAGLVKGRKLTGYKAIQDELRQAGANVHDAAVVSDKNWLTSRTPDDLDAFCEAVVTQFDVNADQSWMARGDVHPAEA